MGNKVTKPSAATGQKVSMSKVSNKLPNPKAISDVLKNNSGGSNPISPRDKNETSKSNAFVTKKSIVDTRIQNKKQKIVVKTKPKETKEKSEVDILQIVKVNNYDYDDYDMINNCIVKHFFMRILDKEARNEIIKEMTLCKVDKGQTIFKQGSIGNFFYIVKEGELQLYINDVFIKNLYEGDNFGELALLHGANRSGAVTAKIDCLLYCLERRNFRKIVEHIKQMNYEENKKFINSIGILTNIEPDSKSNLASNLIKEHHEAGKFIVKEGEIGNCLYIIKEGQVGCSTDGKCIRLLEKGDHFGEMSILLDSVRTMDVIAKTNCEVFCITVDTIKSVAGERYKDVLYLNFIKMAIGKSKFFNKINMKLIENAYECFSFQNYANNDKIVKAGTAISAKIIVVIQGNIFNKKINQLVAKAGDILYEEQVAGLSRDVVSHDLVAEPDCLLAHALTENFIKYMGGSSSFKDIIKKSNCLDSIGKIPLFKNFPQSKLDTLSSIITVQKIENGKKIITQGEVNDKFYIIKSGKVDIYINSGYVRTLNVFESFGERALFFSEPRTATAQANGTVELYVLLSQDFNKILEDNLSDHLKNRLHLQDNSIELKDLDYIKDLGAGSFGTVCLVRSRKTKYEYAIKSMSRKQIDHEQLHGNIDLEKKILLQIDHPFIVKLVKTLKTDKHIYFLMEYVRGKELYEVIRDIGLLSKFQTQFFSGSIMQAVNYLHERKYIYRDIKPENVMVSINVRNT
jgi:cGMP-dependent protein kinase